MAVTNGACNEGHESSGGLYVVLHVEKFGKVRK